MEFICQLFLLVEGLRNELVERRVKQTEGDGLAVHNLHCGLGGFLYERLQFLDGQALW